MLTSELGATFVEFLAVLPESPSQIVELRRALHVLKASTTDAGFHGDWFVAE
jgi:hypothetical protein